MHRALVWIATMVLFGSCTNATEPTCTDEARPGVVVRVLDASSGAELTGGSGVVRDGEYVEELQTFQATLLGAHERAGTYRVEVKRAEYQPWLREDVRVTLDRCHVRTVHLDARLTPAP